MKIIPGIIVTLWGAVIMSAPVMAASAGVQSYKVNIMAPTCSIPVGAVEVKLGDMYKDLIVMGQDPYTIPNLSLRIVRRVSGRCPYILILNQIRNIHGGLKGVMARGPAFT